jgi:pimeloyl-ACP methyl ester carboxylesterase
MHPNGEEVMPYRRLVRLSLAPDGTHVAYHVHVGDVPEARAEEVLSQRTPVLLTNGIGTSENFWRYIVADLEQDHRVAHWDYRGHGQSEVSAKGDYALRVHVDDLERITREVMARGDGRPPHHVGFSMGVRVVLELYRRRPELVPSMTLIAGGPATPDPSAWFLRLVGGRDMLGRAMRTLTPLVPVASPLVHRVLASRLAYPLGRVTGLLRARAPRADIQELTLALARMDPRGYWMMMRGLLEAPSSWDVLPLVRVPTLLVAAKNDLLVPMGEMERMRQLLPHARWLLVEDAGHAGLVEAGTEIAEAVRHFLRSSGLERRTGTHPRTSH